MTETPLKPCPFCGGAGEMIHPMGESLSKGPPYYGPNGSRIVCTSSALVCCAMTASFHGPDQDAKAIAAWNTRTVDTELLEALALAERTMRLAHERMRKFAKAGVGIHGGACPKYGEQELRLGLQAISAAITKAEAGA